MSADFAVSRERVFEGRPTEGQFGYCRAIRVGDRVIVSGTTALVPEGGTAPELVGDMYGQAKVALERIRRALAKLDLTMAHVIKTNVYITDPSKIPELTRAHQEEFGDIKPAALGVIGVAFLWHPDLLVEIDVEAMP